MRGGIPAALITLLLCLSTPVAAAQGGRGPLRLEVRPRAGDTLHVRLEQRVEMSGVMRIGDTDSTVTMRNELWMLGRTVVHRSESTGTTVLSIIDSVQLQLAQQSSEVVETMRRGLQGQRLRMRVAPDGAASLLNAPDEVPGEMHAMVAQMPATLPEHPVRVGERWSREMKLPIAGQGVDAPGGSVRVTFRLDSLDRSGRYAHISMRGALSREQVRQELPNGFTVTMTGTLTGQLVLDRQRGWMTDSRSIVTVQTIFTPPVTDAQPMSVGMRVTQRMHTLDIP